MSDDNSNFQGISYHIAEYSKPLTGYRKWAAEHQMMYPDETELRKECEEYIAEFDEREKLKLQREKEMAEKPDEVIFFHFFLAEVVNWQNYGMEF